MKNSDSKKYFGTDGIRGVYGEDLTDGLAMLAGNSLGMSSDGGTVVVGRDTRASGANLSRALAEGVLSAAANVVDLGVVTTPCVAYVTRALGAASGVMISASHNPPEYNGIKVFGADGRKLPEEGEAAVERHIAGAKLSYAGRRGELLPSQGLTERYVDAVCRRTGRLDGLHVVLDCANGAAGRLAPEIFSRCGAAVTTVFALDDGESINRGCGALHPDEAAAETVRRGADLGLSFDGDADRVIACDEKGRVVDGDRILYVLARALLGRGRLPRSSVVGTLHTNLGAEAALKKSGISLVRTDIGDHNVTARMCGEGFALGGEQSGHIILGDFLPTGDGVYAGAALAAVIRDSGKPLSELADFPLFPQSNADVVTDKKDLIAKDAELLFYTAAVEAMLGEGGRVMLRPSGTEPKLRIMAESKDPFLAAFAARSIEMFVRTHFEP